MVLLEDSNPNNVAMGLLVSVHNINLDLESNGHMVPLSTSVAFELYNCIVIYNYSYQVINSLNSFKLENLCYGGIYFKTYAKIFEVLLVDTS